MCILWTIITTILPIIFFTLDDTQVVAIILLSLGLFVCLFLSSFRTFLLDGVLCQPTSPPLASSWSEAGVLGEEGKQTTKTVKNLTVIFNPHGGATKKGLSKIDVCKAVWEKKGISVEVLETTHAGHCKELAEEVNLDGCDALVAIGGDGTVHELCNGFLSRKEKPANTTLGFCPGGSGNSVMCDFGTWSLEEGATIIADGKTADMDVCKVETDGDIIASVNTIIFGLIGDIGVMAEAFRWCGPSRYENVAGIKLLCSYKQHVKMRLTGKDGKVSEKDDWYLTCFINQTQHFGKGLRAAPSALVDDGLFDLICIKAGATSRGELLSILQQAPTGAHINNKNTEMFQLQKAEIMFDAPGVFNVDGEIVKHNGKVVITCFKKHVNVFADVNMRGGQCK